jgi:CheY-like chemotaxis protein
VDETDNLALVPRPPGALEKTEPGVKRILSGMVADTLALAKQKSPRIVLVDDEEVILMLYQTIVPRCFKNVTLKAFQHRDEAWQELSRADPDLLITDMRNDNVPGRTQYFGMSGWEMLPLLADRKAEFPILVVSGSATEKDVRECAGPQLNVTFLRKPFTPSSLQVALEAALRIQRATVEKPFDIDMHLRRTRPPKIVVVNDEPILLDAYEAIIRSCLADVTVLRFDDGEEAWKELVREDPDLLITDLNRAKFNGFHMLLLLAERKVKYPILVLSGVASSNSDKVKESTFPNLNVTLRQMPFSPDQLKRDLSILLSPIDQLYTDVRMDEQ